MIMFVKMTMEVIYFINVYYSACFLGTTTRTTRNYNFFKKTLTSKKSSQATKHNRAI